MTFDNEKTLSEIFAVSEEIYKDMSDDISDTDHGKLYDAITHLGKTLSGSERTCFWKWDKRTHTLRTRSAAEDNWTVMPDNSGLVGKALSERMVIVTNHPYSDPDFDPDEDRREIEYRLLTRRNKDKTTLREQLDARRHMEALRAYQSEVRTHDKLAGGAPKQGT